VVAAQTILGRIVACLPGRLSLTEVVAHVAPFIG
jgi:hypothetical protein